ncbi:MAG: hypothetical protein JWQ84_2765 [Mucilaginibacter sp.]|nr:hypothetical protein [Mucilaginibacter sp.]
MKLHVLLIILIFFSAAAFSQDAVKTNPVIYGDAGLGIPLTGTGGIQFNTSFNYQVKKSLFTLRLIEIESYKSAAKPLSSYTIWPGFTNSGNMTEVGFLYGWRTVSRAHSFSFSAGVSFNDRTTNYTDSYNQKKYTENRYPGIPFEINVLWFKSSKKGYHIYNIFPVGKPTGFGNSIGFKLSGNLSQHSYLSLGLVMGIGYHKQYK